jgi:branched-chain amino acid aminotransferase
MSDLTIELSPSSSPRSAEERAGLLQNPGFGQVFTDHMVSARYAPDLGWHDAQLTAYAPLTLDPATSVLHYGQAIFEGLKAYHQPDGGVALFRPDQNAARFQRSARRLAMAEVPAELFLDAISALVKADRDWVPTNQGEALYLRPLEFALDPFLGVRPSREYQFLLFASPAGAYFSGGVKPVRIWLSENYARAGKGGTGAAKTGGNYASSLLPQAEAYEKGCDQVVFLDADRNVEELGGMNVVFVFKDGRVVTPASESILEGITRDTLLQLAEDRGLTVERRAISLDEWRAGVVSGDIVEVFACGTAAVVTPIGALVGEGFEDAQPLGELAMSLREELTDIQYGRREDKHGWLLRLDA